MEVLLMNDITERMLLDFTKRELWVTDEKLVRERYEIFRRV